ncbi:MAG: DNA polymerase I [Patescibacteria group bacterium]
MKRFIIIDGNALVHRAFHALPPLSTKEGLFVNAVYGFTMILMRVLKEYHPEYIAVTFDLPAPTFRHKKYAEYKATRIKQPQELYDQLPLVKDVVRAFRIPVLEKEGFEADDLIATLSARIEKELPDTEDIIVTGDMDTLQLVDENTRVYSLKRGLSDILVYDLAMVRERFGLAPEQMNDYKALRGDPSDNIPGVRGIGEKTAIELLQKFGTLGKVLTAAEAGDESIRVRVRELLITYKKDAILGRELVELVKDAPLSASPLECARQESDKEKLRELFTKFEFRTLLPRLDSDEKSAEKQKEKVLPAAKQGTLEDFLQQVKKNEKFSALITDNLLRLASGDAIAQAQWPLSSSEKKILDPMFKSRALKVLHRAKKFIKALQKEKESIEPPFFDLEIAAYLLNPGRRAYELADIAREYHEDTAGLAQVALRLEQKLGTALREVKEIELFQKIEIPLVTILSKMEMLGIKIDEKYLNGLSKQFGKRIDDLNKKIYRLAGYEFNINSPAQIREVLFGKLGLGDKGVRIKKTPGGESSTAAGELEKMRGMHPIVDLIFEHREFAKLRSTYTDALPELIDPRDGRVHTTFNQTVAATGRLSSSDPNLQNIPIRTESGRAIRKAFVAEKGWTLLSADYSQIELRVAASLSGDQKMIAAFQDGRDFHTQTAALVFGVASEKVTAEMRRAAKAVNFGILYGMGSDSLAKATGFSRGQAQGFIEKYFVTFHGLRRFLDGCIKQAREKGYVETLFGRRRYLPEITSGFQRARAQAERMALNHPIQGTAADLMKLAMIKVYPLTQTLSPTGRGQGEEGVRMLLQVHDELVFEVKEKKALEIALSLRALMEGVHALKVPLEVEIKTGHNWGEMKPIGKI